MKLFRYVPFVFACILLLASCNSAQPAPPWELDASTAKLADSAEASSSAAAGEYGTPQNSANAKPTEAAQVNRMPYKDLFDQYVKNGKTVTCEYKGKKLEVLVEIIGTENAVVSCPVVVGLDNIEYINPRDSKSIDLMNNYEIALADQYKQDTNSDQYDTDPEVRKAIDKMAYNNMQLVKKEFRYKYDWQVLDKAGPTSRLIKNLPDGLLAGKQYDFQTTVDDNTAWALADVAVKKMAEQSGVDNSFIPEMEKRLTQWKSRWYESLTLYYYQLFDGISTLPFTNAFTNGAILEFATDTPYDQYVSVIFSDEGVSYQRFHLYRIVRRTAKGDGALITPECAMESALQWLDHLDGNVYKRNMQQPTHIVYAYYPMNSAKGVDYKKGEWLMVPFCYVYFNAQDGDYGPICPINALTGKVY